ncbi:MAG: gliding motility-associated C-terminal domain-containing protein [Bergeyella sp.]|nr:gliding motility-associated C-terminal domain-containing protein [Bergeyella sp.]
MIFFVRRQNMFKIKAESGFFAKFAPSIQGSFMRLLVFRLLVFVCVHFSLFSFFDAQSGSPAPFIATDSDGNKEANIDCKAVNEGRNCLSLQVNNLPELYLTSQYKIESIADFTGDSPYLPYDQGTTIESRDNDDYFTKSVRLPFNFCFFNQSFTSIIISPNGVVSFEASLAEKFNEAKVNLQNPNPKLPKNSIFGIYHDLIFNKNKAGRIKYQVVGSVPNRKMVINFYKGIFVGCPADTSTSQIVLHEGTNIIEIFVKNKAAICSTAKHPNSLLGIMNGNGRIGYTPMGRNTGIWDAGPEAWRFSPTGSTAVRPMVKWTSDKGTVLWGEKVKVCPTKTTAYTAEVSYDICGIYNLGKDEVKINVPSPDLKLKKYSQELCAGDTKVNLDDYKKWLTERDPNELVFSYFLSKREAKAGSNPQVADQIITDNTIWYVRVAESKNPECFKIITLEFKIVSFSLKSSSVKVCAPVKGSVIKGFALSRFNNRFVNSEEIRYFLTLEDANSNINEKTNADLTENMELWVRVKSKNCYLVKGPVKIIFDRSPELKNKVAGLCAPINGNVIEKYKTQDLNDQWVSGSDKIRYFLSEKSAREGKNEITEVDITEETQLWVRVLTPTCEFVDGPVTVKFTRYEVDEKDIKICRPLNSDISGNYAVKNFNYRIEKNATSIKYYRSEKDAREGVNEVETVDLDVVDGLWVRVNNGKCEYVDGPIKIDMVDVVPDLKTKEPAVCKPLKGNTIKDFVLDILTPQLVKRNKIVSYYLKKNDAVKEINEVKIIELSENTELWVRVKSKEKECEYVEGPIKVKFEDPKKSVNKEFKICVPVNGVEYKDYRLSLLDAQLGIFYDKVRYYASQSDAVDDINELKITNLSESTLLWIRVKESTYCEYVDGPIKIRFTNNSLVGKFDVIVCGPRSGDTVKDYVLRNLDIQLVSGQNLSYYLSESDARMGKDEVLKADLTEKTKLWVRSKSGGCDYVDGPISVKFTYEKLYEDKLLEKELCDNYRTGKVGVNLSGYNAEIKKRQDNTVKNISYHESLEDAQANINPQNSLEVSNGQTFVVRLEPYVGCAGFMRIRFNLKAPPKIKEKVEANYDRVCNNNNTGVGEVDLTVYEKEIYTGVEKVTFEYFARYSESGNSFSYPVRNPKNYSTRGNETVYVRVRGASGCADKSELSINLSFYPGIFLNKGILEKCDRNFNFTQEFFLDDVIPQMYDKKENKNPLSGIEVTYHNTYRDAINNKNAIKDKKVIGSAAKMVLWARFTLKEKGCYTVQSVELYSYFPPKAILSTIPLCDDSFRYYYTVNLLDYTDNMVPIANPKYKFYFYYTEEDAKEDKNRILTPEKFIIKKSDKIPRIYVRIEIIGNCYDVNAVNIEYRDRIKLNSSGPFLIDDICDEGNDGKEIIDITRFEKILVSEGVFTYYTSFTDLQENKNAIDTPKAFLYDENTMDMLYVRVSKTGFCDNYAKFRVKLKESPMFALPDYYFCPYNDGSVEIAPDLSAVKIASYVWRSPAGEIISTDSYVKHINKAGVYSVEVVGENGCPFKTTFNVLPYEVPVIEQLIPNGNSFTVVATGSKPIVYSVDKINWQKSGVFPNVTDEITTFYVKFDGASCLGLPRRGLLPKIYNVITPNGDGVNDVWRLKNLDVFMGYKSSVQIFDRYYKLVFEETSDTEIVWDGTSNRRPVNTGTYWYIIGLPDGRKYQGWILVKNRN